MSARLRLQAASGNTPKVAYAVCNGARPQMRQKQGAVSSARANAISALASQAVVLRLAHLLPLACVLLSLWCAGCSLDYGKEENSEDTVPEFMFTGAHFTRVEENKRKLQITAEKIEQYKSDNASFARDAQFKTFDKDEKPDTEGTCGLISIDTKNEVYKLFNNIAVNIVSQDTRLRAETLQFNGKTEQLTAGRDDLVSVERKNATVSGKGFSASGVSRSYMFLSDVSGVANVDDKDSANEQ